MKLINALEGRKDLGYEPPYNITWGVDRDTTGAKQMAVGRTLIPPAGKNKLHYHTGCDTCYYVVRGPIYVYIRERERLAKHVAPPGHFVFHPRHEIHCQENPSLTDEAELIFVYGGVGHRDEGGTIFVE